MFFSIIIPCYNVEQYLRQCVDSVCNQSFRSIEIILVDDGSPDSCPALCDSFAKKDSRVKVIHKRNGGLSDARNVGLKEASGDYVVFLDSDDWWCDLDALSKINERLAESNADVLLFQSKKYYQLSGTYYCKPVGSIPPSPRFIYDIKYLMRHSLFVACAWDKVVRRQALIDGQIEFVVGQLSEDIEWCCKLLAQNLSFTVINDVIHVYRQQNNASITSNITNKNLADIQGVINRWSRIAFDRGNEPILHFLALEFILLSSISDKASEGGGRKILSEMSSFFYLLDYDWYPRVALVARIRFLGFNLVRRLLVIARMIRGLGR